MKKLIFALLLYPLFLFAEEAPYDLIVSLGGNCEAAYQLQWLKLRQTAFPFDWCVTPFEGLYKFIADNGANFLERGNLIRKPNCVEDTVYHMLFLHDFDMKRQNPLRDYPEVKAKYNRRIERFFNALNSNKKILFIRVQISFEQATRLDKLLHSRYPHLTYTILAIDETEEITRDWGLERIKNVYHKNLSDWPSALEEWRVILSHFPFSLINESPLRGDFSG